MGKFTKYQLHRFYHDTLEEPSRDPPSRDLPSRELPSRELPSREQPSRDLPSLKRYKIQMPKRAGNAVPVMRTF